MTVNPCESSTIQRHQSRVERGKGKRSRWIAKEGENERKNRKRENRSPTKREEVGGKREKEKIVKEDLRSRLRHRTSAVVVPEAVAVAFALAAASGGARCWQLCS